MGTEKRERQKANRLQRQIEEARDQRASAVKRNLLRWFIVAIAAVGGVVLIAWIGGAFDSDDEGQLQTSDEPPVVDDAEPVETFPVPPKPDVVIPSELPTELVVTDLVEGSGEGAQVGDTVLVHYVGVRSEDGVEFDNSYERGTPFPVVLGTGGVIRGWDEGLVGAKVGGQRQLDIPSELAYGDADRGIIRPGDALTFVVDILAVTPAGQQ